jgi:hypothetical protein
MGWGRVTGWGLAMGLFGAVSCEAADSAPTSIRVSVCDVAEMPAQTRNLSVATAERVLASAQVAVEWSMDCERIQKPGEMNLLIVPQTPRHARVSEGSMGATDHPSVRGGRPNAWVFLDRTCEFGAELLAPSLEFIPRRRPPHNTR